MSFKSVLKEIGEDALKVTAGISAGLPIVSEFAPLFTQFLSAKAGATVNATLAAAGGEITQIAGVIADVEATSSALAGKDPATGAIIPGLTGAQKLQAAVPDIGKIILDAYEAMGFVPGDSDLVAKGIAECAQGSVDVFNGMKKK